MSIDTRRKEVAQATLDDGAIIINDVSGFQDDLNLEIMAKIDAGPSWLVMYMMGNLMKTMSVTHYDSFPGDIYTFFERRVAELELTLGIAQEKIIIDPGIGFGKTFDQNLILIKGQ